MRIARFAVAETAEPIVSGSEKAEWAITAIESIICLLETQFCILQLK
jgi:hypothetical protein